MSTVDVTLWSTRDTITPPHMVEAIHLTDEADWWATAWWCRGSLTGTDEVTITVQTINGPQVAKMGDYIVHHGPGDFAVSDAESFLFTYQQCDDDGDPL